MNDSTESRWQDGHDPWVLREMELAFRAISQAPDGWSEAQTEALVDAALEAQLMGHRRIQDVWSTIEVLPDYLWMSVITHYANGGDRPTSEQRQTMLEVGLTEANRQMLKTASTADAPVTDRWNNGTSPFHDGFPFIPFLMAGFSEEEDVVLSVNLVYNNYDTSTDHLPTPSPAGTFNFDEFMGHRSTNRQVGEKLFHHKWATGNTLLDYHSPKSYKDPQRDKLNQGLMWEIEMNTGDGSDSPGVNTGPQTVMSITQVASPDWLGDWLTANPQGVFADVLGPELSDFAMTCVTDGVHKITVSPHTTLKVNWPETSTGIVLNKHHDELIDYWLNREADTDITINPDLGRDDSTLGL